jgi:hypothetical protein
MKILSMTALAITFSMTGFYLSAQTAKMSSAGSGDTKHLFPRCSPFNTRDKT